MNKRSSVLVGVDFSAPSRRAVEVATAVSARADLPLQLLHVWNARQLLGAGGVVPELEAWIPGQKARLREQLDQWARDARESGVAVSSKLVEGVASRVIPDLARSSGAGLVVVGRRGAASLSHVLLGSVSERVVHAGACPVLVVPLRTSTPQSPRRLMVGVDFSYASKDAYRVALRMAVQLGASRGLVLVHARPADADLWLEDWSELAYRRDHPQDAAAVKRWAGAPEGGQVPIEVRVLEGRVETLLLSAAEREGCDWLVLGLQGRTALAALMMGSTTDRILKLADRPVLVVPTTSMLTGEATS